MQNFDVPFITGWASSKDAVTFLNDSLKVDPTNKITIVFLAEAMVNKRFTVSQYRLASAK